MNALTPVEKVLKVPRTKAAEKLYTSKNYNIPNKSSSSQSLLFLHLNTETEIQEIGKMFC